MFLALPNPMRRGILERLGRGPATLTQFAWPGRLERFVGRAG